MKRFMKPFLLAGFFWFGISAAHANPQFNHTEAGDIRIEESGPMYNIYSADRSIGAFNSFGNLAGETINSIQALSSDSVVFKVVGTEPSLFFGALNANSHVFLVNPNGIIFKPGSQVNAPGLLAAAMDLKSADFAARDFKFAENLSGSGYVLNEGHLRSGEGGYVALLGRAVENRGLIETPGGTTILGAAGAATVSLDGDGGISLTLTKPIDAPVYDLEGNRLKDGLRDTGAIFASGGLVLLSAQAMDAVFDQVINLSGVVEANTVEDRNGVIVLGGGNEGVVAVTGNLSARGEDAGENGGEIRVLGDKVAVLPGAVLDASGESGGLIELSGDQLFQRGSLNVEARTGASGTLFYDPLVIQIVGGTGDGSDNTDASLSVISNFPGSATVGSILFSDEGAGSPNPFIIRESEIEGTIADIILEARQSISTSGTFGGTELLIANNHDLTLRTQNDAASGPGTIDLTSSADGSNLLVRTQGTGSISLEGSASGAANADIRVGKLQSATGDIDLWTSHGSIILTGNITTAGGFVDIEAGTSGDVTVAPSASTTLTIKTSGVGAGGDVDIFSYMKPGVAGTDLTIDTSGISVGDDGGFVFLLGLKGNPAVFLNDLLINANSGGGAGVGGTIYLEDIFQLGDNAADVATAAITGGPIYMAPYSSIRTPKGTISLISDSDILLGELNADFDADNVRGTAVITATDAAAATGLGIEDGNGNFANVIAGTTTFTTPNAIGLSSDVLELDVTSLVTTGVLGGVFVAGLHFEPPPPPETNAGVILEDGRITSGDNFDQYVTSASMVTQPGTEPGSETEQEKEKDGNAPQYVAPGSALPPPPLVEPPATFQQETKVEPTTFNPCPA